MTTRVRDQIAAGRPRRGRPGHDLDSVRRVAIDVFVSRGYDGATMGDVAAELGISKSALYHHVAGKEEILSHALDRALDALEAVLADARRSSAPAGAQLEDVVRRAVDVLVAELPSVTLLLRVHGNSEVERSAMVRRRAIDAELAGVVERAQRDGAVRADISPPLVSRLIFGTINSLTEWLRPRSSLSSEAVADAVCRLVFDGIRQAIREEPSSSRDASH